MPLRSRSPASTFFTGSLNTTLMLVRLVMVAKRGGKFVTMYGATVLGYAMRVMAGDVPVAPVASWATATIELVPKVASQTKLKGAVELLPIKPPLEKNCTLVTP